MAATSRATEDISAIRVFRAAVRAVRPLTARMVRITLGGGDLPEFESGGLDQFAYVFFPAPGEWSTPVDRSFTWEKARQLPEAERPVGRYYTIRHHRPDLAEVDIDVMLHGSGPGAGWAARARVGEQVALWGPRTAYRPDPATRWQLLIADETGLPAVANILEGRPPGMTTSVLVEVGGGEDELPLAGGEGVSIRWLHRGATAPGKSTRLIEAVRSTAIPDGDISVWGAAEAGALTAIRAHLQDERGLPAGTMQFVPYWRLSGDDIRGS